MHKRLAIGLAMLAMLIQGGCAEVQSIASKTQAPIYPSLTPFLIFNGYYVNLNNTSDSALTGVYITYYDSQGNTVTQQVGSIGPKESVSVDPSEVNWRVTKHEKIAVHADGYLRRVVETNVLIDQL
jgi:hypothetical protein